MLTRFIAVATLSSTALAVPLTSTLYDSSNPPVLTLGNRTPLHFLREKRQSTSAADEEAAISGYQDLLLSAESSLSGNSLEGQCATDCNNFLRVTDICINQETADEAITCQCTTETIVQMIQCASCISDEQWNNAKGFQSLCATLTSSLSASAPSSTSSSSDPFNGLGTVTVGTDAVTIATFDPSVNYFTRTSDVWDSTALRNGDGTFTGSRTSTASRASETGAVSGGEDATDAAVSGRVGKGAVLGVVGVVAALVAL
ncbi:hypothetical protein JCM8547_009004 [Rhodosporidiobolus lusitaniae]